MHSPQLFFLIMGKISAICPVMEPPSTTDGKIKQFYIDIAKGFIELNALIHDYNNEIENPANQRKYLHQIYIKQKALSHQFPQRMIELCPEYRRSIHHQLFTELKNEFAGLNITSLQENTLEAQMHSINLNVDPTSLPEIIANMPPKKVDNLLKILSEGAKFNRNQLLALYLPKEPGYDDFQQFLQVHAISYLDGGNSHNFKIINFTTGQTLVLKIDYRVRCPRHADTFLRARSLQNVCTPIWAEREGSFINNSRKTVTRSLIVTDFCQGSDLEKHAKLKRSSCEQIAVALDVYLQMATILSQISNDGCAFTDMKNSNWLIDNGLLKLADTKSFLFINQERLLDMQLSENYWFDGITATQHLIPPELKHHPVHPVHVDKLHAFMLGRNLYQFLTKKEIYDLEHISVETNIDFSNDVFLTPPGKLLRTLIEKLTQNDPNQRISIHKAMNTLKKIKSNYELSLAQQRCFEYLTTFKQYQCSFNENEINKSIDQGTELIFQTTNYKDIPALEEKLHVLENNLIEHMELGVLKEKCKAALMQMHTLQFGTADSEMMRFILAKTQELQKKTTKIELQLLNQELSGLIAKIANNPVIKELRTIIASFRNDCRFYTIGMKAKAQRIETAMAQVPLLDRANILDKQSISGKLVLRELASHRHIFRANPVNEKGEINSAKAANTYRLFTAKFSQAPTTEMKNLRTSCLSNEQGII